MTIDEISEVLAEVKFEEYTFGVGNYGTAAPLYLYASYVERDTVTGILKRHETRHWILGKDVTPSLVVSTAFLCVKTSMEHRAREWFLYKNRPIYMPHYDVEDLVTICEERHTE